jgi:hypothetical protein
MRSEGNAPKNGKPKVGFSLTTIESWFLLNDKAAAHQSVLANYFLAKNSVQH